MEARPDFKNRQLISVTQLILSNTDSNHNSEFKLMKGSKL